MTSHTSRRALLKGAAMLTAIPVAALAGVPVFDVVEGVGASQGPDLSTMEGRIAAVCDWFALPRPILTYDPDEPGELLLTDDLMAWWRASAVSFDWLVCGEPVSDDPRAMVTAERRKRLQEREFVEILKRLDDTEVRLLGDAMERSLRDGVPMEVALADCKRAIDAYRATRWVA